MERPGNGTSNVNTLGLIRNMMMMKKKNWNIIKFAFLKPNKKKDFCSHFFQFLKQGSYRTCIDEASDVEQECKRIIKNTKLSNISRNY